MLFAQYLSSDLPTQNLFLSCLHGFLSHPQPETVLIRVFTHFSYLLSQHAVTFYSLQSLPRHPSIHVSCVSWWKAMLLHCAYVSESTRRGAVDFIDQLLSTHFREVMRFEGNEEAQSQNEMSFSLLCTHLFSTLFIFHFLIYLLFHVSTLELKQQVIFFVILCV